MAVTEEDINCKLARRIYGWDTPTEDDAKWGSDFSVGLYSKDAETAAKFEQNLYPLNSEHTGLIISPLSRTVAKTRLTTPSSCYGFHAELKML